jgi:hypothetical protein
MTITLPEQIACVKREIAMRHSVYGKRVRQGAMNEQGATVEIERMKAVLDTLESINGVHVEVLLDDIRLYRAALVDIANGVELDLEDCRNVAERALAMIRMREAV